MVFAVPPDHAGRAALFLEKSGRSLWRPVDGATSVCRRSVGLWGRAFGGERRGYGYILFFACVRAIVYLCVRLLSANERRLSVAGFSCLVLPGRPEIFYPNFLDNFLH